MNQIIEELAKLAGMSNTPTGEKFDDFNLEEFAKLIIKECINEVSQYHCTTINNGFIPESITNAHHYEWGYIKGTEEGYNDAVDQIIEGLTSRFDVEG